MSETEDLLKQMQQAIEETLPGAEVEVRPSQPGHFEIRVKSEQFSGKSRVQQQQMVYGAIGPFMKGGDAPVHAIDRLETLTS